MSEQPKHDLIHDSFYLPYPKKVDMSGGGEINKALRFDANYTLGRILKCAIGLALASPEDLVKSCINCDFFNEKTEGCKQANGQRPPARVIAFGCKSHQNINDEIPF